MLIYHRYTAVVMNIEYFMGIVRTYDFKFRFLPIASESDRQILYLYRLDFARHYPDWHLR